MTCDDAGSFSARALDHALHPRHYGPAQECDGHVRIKGPCGDTMEFWVSLRDGVLERVSFVTDGCGASRACGSMAVSLAEGRSLEEALQLEQAEILAALGDFPAESEHCALLAATTLHSACRACQGRDTAGNGPAEAGANEEKEGS